MGTILFLIAFTTEGLSVFIINPLVISLNTVFALYVLSGLLHPDRSRALQPCWTRAWRGAAEWRVFPGKEVICGWQSYVAPSAESVRKAPWARCAAVGTLPGAMLGLSSCSVILELGG